MEKMDFPNLKPPAVDSPEMKRPVVVNVKDVDPIIEFPDGRGKTKYLLTDETAGCRYINLGLFYADPGEGSQWHTHPRETGEEEYLYILEGGGSLYYKQDGRDHEIGFQKGDAIFTGHLTHYLRNTRNEELVVMFGIAPLPARTIIHGVENDQGRGYVDSLDIRPPRIIRPEDIKATRFGTIIARHLLTSETVGSKIGRLATAIEQPGMGSTWHTHPSDPGEEDLFYVASGGGTYVYLQNGKVHTFEFKKGDAIHSHHLTNYTINTFSEDAFIPLLGAPNPQQTIIHEKAGK